MEHDNYFVFKLGCVIGSALNLLGLGFVNFPPFLQIHTFSEWALMLGLKLFELALAGLVTGFCGIAGKRYYEKKYGKKIISGTEKD
jgi:hypothetical protein